MHERISDDLVYMREMLRAADKVHEIVERWSRAVYDEKEVLQYALRYLALVISETASQVSNERKTRYPEIPWTRIAGMRQELYSEFSISNLNTPWITESKSASQLSTQLVDAIHEEFGLELKPFSLEIYREEISAYCETQPIERLSGFAPGFEGWIRPYTDIGLLVDYVPDASISLLDMAGHEIALGEIIGKRVSLFTTNGLRQSPYQVPFDIGGRLYELEN